MDFMDDFGSKYALVARHLLQAGRPRWALAVSSPRTDLALRPYTDGDITVFKVSSCLDLSAGRDGPVCNYASAVAATEGHWNVTRRTLFEEAFGGSERRPSMELARDVKGLQGL